MSYFNMALIASLALASHASTATTLKFSWVIPSVRRTSLAKTSQERSRVVKKGQE